MSLETGTRIADLVPTNPVGATDFVQSGDDHIRLIKACLQGSFPSLGAGQVTATAEEISELHSSGVVNADLVKLHALTPTAAELNYVDGVTSAIQTQLDAKQATLTGAATSIASSNLTADRALISDGSGKVAVSSDVSATELGYLDGVTSAIQTQLDAKQATLTGAATSIASSNLTADRALISDGSGKVAVSSGVSATELGYLDGVTSAIQTQIDAAKLLDFRSVSSNVSAQDSDTGKVVYLSTGCTAFNLHNNGNAGCAFLIINETGGNVSITTSNSLNWENGAGGSSGTRTLANGGVFAVWAAGAAGGWRGWGIGVS